MNKFKRLTVPLFLAVGLVLSACSAGGGSDAGDLASPDYGVTSMDEDSGEAARSFSQERVGAEDSPPESTEYVIKTASVTLQVEDVEEKLTEVRGVVDEYDGDVEYSETRIRDRQMTASSTSNYQGDYRYPSPVTPVGDYAYLTLSVPVDKLDPFLDDVRELGDVVTDSTAEEDVTLNVLGLDAQIESETASLTRLEELLNRANSVDEVLQVEREIQNRKNNIASMNAQVNSLKNRASESTVTVQLVTDKAVELSPEEMNWFERTWDKISDGSSDTVAYSVIIVIFLIPLLGLLFLVKAVLDKLSARRVTRHPELFNRPGSNHSHPGVSQTSPAAQHAPSEEPSPAPGEGVTEDERE